MMSTETDFQLREAMRADDSAPIAEYVRARGIDARYGGKQFKSVLYGAAGFNARKTAMMLLRKGADVNARSWHGNTPLHAVVMGGSPKILQMLLRRNGVEIDARNKQGETPLCLAAKLDRRICAEILRAKGADPGAKDKRGGTPESYEERHASARRSIVECFRESSFGRMEDELR